MNDFLDKYQVPVGIGLVILIVIGSVMLLFEQQRDKLAVASSAPTAQQAAWEKERSELEGRVQTLEAKNTTASTTSTGKVAGASTSTSSSGSSATKTVTGVININTADAATLDSLPGIGTVRAQEIIAYRQAHGGFKTIDEIKEVKGIGDSIFGKIKSLISVK